MLNHFSKLDVGIWHSGKAENMTKLHLTLYSQMGQNGWGSYMDTI